MFPAASRDSKLTHNYFSAPKEQRPTNKSGQLPYFKRFPHNRFKSQEKVKVKVKINHALGLSHASPPKNNSNQFTFFRQYEEQQAPRYNFNSSIVNRRSSKIKPRHYNKAELFKHLQKHPKQQQQQESTRHQRIKTDNPTQFKVTIQNLSTSKNNKPQKPLTAARILQMEKGILTQFQILEIGAYEEVYYYGQHCVRKNQNLKQMSKQDGSYVWVKGDHIAYRYQICEELGQGSFGQVLKCFDHKRKIDVAVKLVKDKQKYTKQARIEVKILNFIKAKDPLSIKNCIQIRDFFMFRSRMCMTFDLMALNLYELSKNNGYYGFPLDLIRRFALQLLNAIHFLHKSGIIHADLKPQNVLLKQSNKSGIKIIDFGSSCFQHETIYTYIQSRYYRAPEVILSLPYDRKIDIWSFGCIIAELHLGYPLFAGQNQHEQMCLLLQVLGKPPESMKKNSKRWKVFFDNQNQLKSHEKKMMPGSKSLTVALQNPSEQEFIDFIRICLEWVPEKRVQALDLLRSQWIMKGLPEDIKRQHLKFIQEEEKKGESVDEHMETKKFKKSSFSIRERTRLF